MEAGYSCYDAIIENIRYRLKYATRHLKNTQRAFHNAEGKLHHALASQHKHGNEIAVLAKKIDKLRLKADFRMEMFCDAFKFQQRLVAELQDVINADAEGKRQLNDFKTTVMQ